MASSPGRDESFRFQYWELRPVERVLLVRGQPVTIGARAFDVLLALVEAQGRVVTKDELLARAWPGLVVEENNISVQVATLRRVLGEGQIVTVQGIGYRLGAKPVGGEPSPAVPAPPPVPPPAPQLFGRADDVELLVRKVGDRPLVSIIGTGGVGKTSLARAVMAQFAGVPTAHWVDLSALREAGALVPLVAKALSVAIDDAAPAALAQALAAEHTLIVLDNCEHLAEEAAGLVGAVIATAPGVRWLVTSQRPLLLAREWVYRLQPLDLPAADAAFEQAVGSAAIALLYYRSASVDREFELTAANIEVAIDLCRRLDGLPLAIEMAAARVPMLGLDGVCEQLGQRLRLPSTRPDAPPRQQTLRATLEWSYHLLTPEEQTVFRRLEPLVGSFTLGMAQRLARDGADGALDDWVAAEALGGLVQKSLVQREAGVRFRLLESARDYARERLAAAGEADAWQHRYAEVVAAQFDPAEADLEAMNDDDWRRRYVPERQHVRAALLWACQARDPPLLARLVAAQARIDSFVRGLSDALQCNVPLDVLRQAPPPLRAAACLELSWAHFLDGSRRLGTELAEQALGDYEVLGHPAGVYRALAQLSRLYETRPNLQQAAVQAWERFRALGDGPVSWRTRLFCAISGGPQYAGTRSVARLQQLQELAQGAGYETLAAICMVQITDQLLVERRFGEAVDAAQRFIAEHTLSPRIKGTILMNEVLALVQLGRNGELAEPVQAALRALPNDAYLVVSHLALAAARAGRLFDAALAMGHAWRRRHERDEQPDAAEAAAVAETQALLEGGLAREAMQDLQRDGAAMPVADLVARLLLMPSARDAAAAAPPGPAP